MQAPASTGREAMQEAISAVPFNRLRPEVGGAIREAIRDPSIYRRLPQQTIACDADLLLFSVRNPDAVVNIWELMGVSGVQLARVGENTFRGTDGQGTTCTTSLVYGTREMQIYVFEGAYEGTMFRRKIGGHGAAILRTSYGNAADGRPLATNTLDVFVRFENLGADIAAKTLHPIFGSTIDANFLESGTFLARLSETGQHNGRGLAGLAEKLTRVDPAVRAKLVQIGLSYADSQAGHEAAMAAAEAPAGGKENRPASAPAWRPAESSSSRTTDRTTSSGPSEDSSPRELPKRGLTLRR